MVRDFVFRWDGLLESVISIKNPEVLAETVNPLISPVVGSRNSPLGRLLMNTFQV
jgi:hypothetical protein